MSLPSTRAASPARRPLRPHSSRPLLMASICGLRSFCVAASSAPATCKEVNAIAVRAAARWAICRPRAARSPVGPVARSSASISALARRAFTHAEPSSRAPPVSPARATAVPLTAGGNEPTCATSARSEEHTSELQSRENLVCRLLLEKKTQIRTNSYLPTYLIHQQQHHTDNMTFEIHQISYIHNINTSE